MEGQGKDGVLVKGQGLWGKRLGLLGCSHTCYVLPITGNKSFPSMAEAFALL